MTEAVQSPEGEPSTVPLAVIVMEEESIRIFLLRVQAKLAKEFSSLRAGNSCYF